MKKFRSTFLVYILVFILGISSLSTSVWANDAADKSVSKSKVIKTYERITDREILFERAMKGISNNPNSDIKVMVNGILQEIDSDNNDQKYEIFSTTQKLRTAKDRKTNETIDTYETTVFLTTSSYLRKTEEDFDPTYAVKYYVSLEYDKTGNNRYKPINVHGGIQSSQDPKITVDKLKLFAKAWGNRYLNNGTSRNVGGNEKTRYINYPTTGSEYTMSLSDWNNYYYDTSDDATYIGTQSRIFLSGYNDTWEDYVNVMIGSTTNPFE